jgi:hypothetical protein
MTTEILPTEQDLNLLKSQIEEAKRKAEYERLKQDLHDIAYKAANTPNEFDGSMQLADTDRVLETKRTKNHFFDLLFCRIRSMFSLRPIIGNIIALLIAGIALFYIFNEVNTTGLKAYQSHFAIGIQIFAAIQIIKSATRGLLLPFLALTLGAAVAHNLGADQTLLHFNKEFYQHLMITGIIGLGVAVLSID